jgi:hypothetical protein
MSVVSTPCGTRTLRAPGRAVGRGAIGGGGVGSQRRRQAQEGEFSWTVQLAFCSRSLLQLGRDRSAGRNV